MRVKDGASLDHASAELLYGISVVEDCFRCLGEEAMVTSAFRVGPWPVTLLHGLERDPKRAHRSGVVDACDFRYPPGAKAPAIIDRIKARLSKEHGGQFDVLDERTNAQAAAAGVGAQFTGAHIHIEWDP